MDAASLDDFLARVEEAEAQIKGLKEGKLHPDEVTIDGVRVTDLEAEERERKEAAAARAAARAAKAARSEEDKRQERLKAEAEEKELWWEFANLQFKPAEEEKSDAERPARISGLDYSKWDKWAANPDDPVTLEEKAAHEAAVEAARDAEFERLNPDFCKQFKDDLEGRNAKQAAREAEAMKYKDKGNGFFKAAQFEDALRLYHKALKMLPLQVPILTNIAQAHIKLGEFSHAVEFCNRALFVDKAALKALFRRAVANRALANFDDAVADLEAALAIDGGNKDLKRELAATRVAQTEAAKEAEGVDPHVLLRTSGKLDDLCAAVVGALPGGTPPDGPRPTPTSLTKSLYTLADACANPVNRQRVVKGGTLERLQAAVVLCGGDEGAAPLTVQAAVLAVIEIVASHRDPGHLRAVVKPPAFLPAVLDAVRRHSEPLAREDTTPTDMVAHACSILQTVASRVEDEEDTRVEAALSRLSQPVEALCLAVASFIARAMLKASLLTSLAMQAATGALANLAQRPAFRPAFMARPPGVDGPAATGYIMRPLLDLQRLPVPASPAFTTVAASALAALCNAAHETPDVLAAIRRSDGLGVVLELLTRAPPPDDVLLARGAALLARLSQDPQAQKDLQKPATYTKLVKLLAASDGRVPQCEDGVVRALAAATKTPAQRELFVGEGGVEAATGLLGRVLAVAGPLQRAPAVGNLAKALIVVAEPTEARLQDRLLAARLPDLVVDLVKRAPDGPVRKNAAVVLARMARHAPSRARIKDLRGMEVLLALSKSGDI